jgi:hypothetical protein
MKAKVLQCGWRRAMPTSDARRKPTNRNPPREDARAMTTVDQIKKASLCEQFALAYPAACERAGMSEDALGKFRIVALGMFIVGAELGAAYATDRRLMRGFRKLAKEANRKAI